MAAEVQIDPASAEKTAKIRHPVAVVVFSLITLGIYHLYWWYQINREMRDLGEARGLDDLGEKPLNSLLAFFPGGLIIVPPYVSLYNGVKRMQRAQEVTTGAVSLNGWIALILLLVLGLILPGYLQAEMNKVWENVGSGGAMASTVPETTAPAPTPQEGGQPPVEPPPPQA
jgi:hypothetical protein